MKHLLILLLILAPLAGMAQNNSCDKDTTLYLNNRKIIITEQSNKIKVKLFESTSKADTIENTQIFEGVYMNGQSSERRALLNVLPFTKKRKNQHQFDPHLSGFYFGYVRFANNFLSFNPSNRASLYGAHAWEFGFNLITKHINLGSNNHWGICGSLGWGYRTMRLDGNYAFREIGEVTEVYPGSAAEEPTEYNKSRLRYCYFRIPVTLEWQSRFNGRKPLFFSVGPEAEIRHGIKSKGKINGSYKTFDKGLNVRPLSINLLAQAGYSNWGIYMRYSTLSLFENNKGPELYPFSFGLQWYW